MEETDAEEPLLFDDKTMKTQTRLRRRMFILTKKPL